MNLSMRHGAFLATLLAGLAIGNAAQAKPPLFKDVAEARIPLVGPRQITPLKARTFSMDPSALAAELRRAPLNPDANTVLPTLRLPMPDGSELAFRIVESQVMQPGLAAKFPMIKTYIGTATTTDGITGRFQMDPRGFRAMIFTPQGTVFIDPFSRGDASNYQVYYGHDMPLKRRPMDTLYTPAGAAAKLPTPPKVALPGVASRGVTISGDLRTYRVAIGTTYEYSSYHDPIDPAATPPRTEPRKSVVLAELVNVVNRVSGVYERELGIRMELITGNEDAIYVTPAQPYTDQAGPGMVQINTVVLDMNVGNQNYDIGHVASTGGGGIAGLGVVCNPTRKGDGVTGLGDPIGDGYYIDFVAHEMGHQFGGNHTFNGDEATNCGPNRNAGTATEPGSGVTIMGYAGVCSGQNIAPHSIDTFNHASFDEIVAYSREGEGNTCARLTNTGNKPPNADAGVGGFTIPKQTPFELTGAGCDLDNDAITYQWEENDLGPAGTPAGAATTAAPLFRSFLPTVSPTRSFPQLSDLLNNTQTMGEVLPNPASSRNMKFRLTVRDNKVFPKSGGVASADLSFTATGTAGPFLVTAPNTAASFTGRQTTPVTWNVANTDVAPVSCPTVNLFLSTNGGNTFPTLLIANVANDGTQEVKLPNVATTTARIKVKCANSVFFDISNTNFTIVKAPNTAPVPRLTATPTSGTKPVAVSFDAATSSDAEDINVASYALNFGDGSPVVTQLQSGFSHTYSTVGDFTASLLVTDSEGLQSATPATVLIKVSEVAQQAVTPFSFVERKDVPINSFISSESVTLAGFTSSLPISVSEGLQYSLNGGAFTAAAGSITAGTRLVVRHVSANAENTAKTSTVTVGSGASVYSTTFKSVTTTLDRVPDAFDFGTKTEQAPGVTVTSEPKTLTGFDEAAVVAGPGIMYRIGSGAFTNARGTLKKGEVLTVQHTSSSSSLGYTKTYLKVGGVTGYFTTRTRK